MNSSIIYNQFLMKRNVSRTPPHHASVKFTNGTKRWKWDSRFMTGDCAGRFI